MNHARRFTSILILFGLLALSSSALFTVPAYALTYTVNTIDDVNDGTCNGTHCSLREAIIAANTNSGPDSINFSISGCGGVCTITPSVNLPFLSDGQTTIDGYTQSGSLMATASTPATLMIEIDGTNVANNNGFNIVSSSNEISGLIINRFGYYGIAIYGSSAANNLILGNIIGTNGSDALNVGNGGGVGIGDAAHDNTIGGDTYADRNVISRNNVNGIDIFAFPGAVAYDNAVSGNYIGTNNLGNSAVGNLVGGIQLGYGTYGNMIGGTLPQERNVISGNGSDGIVIWRPLTHDNTLYGNFIGTSASGLAAVPNGGNGVSIYGESDDNVIGGDAYDERNVISGNSLNGVRIYGSGTTGNIVSGNYIGTKSNGTEALANSNYGVLISESAANNTIGGPTYNEGNVISGNTGDGVHVSNSASSNTISANRIGTLAGGYDALPNGDNGIVIRGGAVNNTVGGDTTGERNVISANTSNGVVLFGATTTGNTISGNRIGTISGGMDALANGSSGVVIESGAHTNTVGGATAGERNLISGNGTSGILIEDTGTNNNQVLGNYIGIDANGILPLANQTEGVLIQLGAASNTIGPGNLISGNTYNGVYLTDSAANNSVIGNLIGITQTGTTAVANNRGVRIDGDAINNIVGGDDPGERNVISGSTHDGVRIQGSGTTGNEVLGNYIGTNISGTGGLQNEYGVFISGGSQNTVVGEAGAGNVISGNLLSGVVLSGTTTTGNRVEANLIGLNASGTGAVQNNLSGIHIVAGAHTNTVGGTAVGDRNIISGNGLHGIFIEGSGTNDNTIMGNYIGTSGDGASSVANEDDGIRLASGAHGNTIGGDVSGEGNVISGNDDYGVQLIDGGTDSNTISGNYIGTDASGSGALGNRLGGVTMQNGAQYNTVGGDTSGERNVISANGAAGVSIAQSGTDNNTISGNYIGLDKSGNGALANDSEGVLIHTGAQSNTIGGSSTGERNVISSNLNAGIRISGAHNNAVEGNYIGTDVAGLLNLGNAFDGVRIHTGATDNTIGPSNRIVYNGFQGVGLQDVTTTGNVITQNSIHSNTFPDGIRLLDGSNGGMTPAFVTTVTLSPLVINGNACAGCTAEVFSNPVEVDEGWNYLGSAVADGGGNWSLSVSVIPGPWLASTATDSTLGTSEFSHSILSTVRSLFLPLIMR